MRIVTFACSKDVHIYYDNSTVSPMPPYKLHQTIGEAYHYLLNRGIDDPEIIENGTNNNKKKNYETNKGI